MWSLPACHDNSQTQASEIKADFYDKINVSCLISTGQGCLAGNCEILMCCSYVRNILRHTICLQKQSLEHIEGEEGAFAMTDAIAERYETICEFVIGRVGSERLFIPQCSACTSQCVKSVFYC